MKNFIIYLLMVFVLISCEKKNDKVTIIRNELSEHNIKSFNHRLEENMKLINFKYIKILIEVDSLNFIDAKKINLIDWTPFETFQAIGILRDNIRDFLFYKYYLYILNTRNSLQQIEYPVDMNGRKKMLIYILGDNTGENHLKSAYICWSSKPYNLPPDYILKDFENFTPLFLWEINFFTDTITSNLSLKTITKLYPNFNGKYVFKKYKEIIIDHAYSSFDRSLFDKIKFVE